MTRPWVDSNTPTKCLERIIETSEENIKDIKKEKKKINLISVFLYIVLVVLVKDVKMINVISSAFLVSAHFNYNMTVNRIMTDNKTDISLAKMVIDFKKTEEKLKKEMEKEDEN